MQDPRRANRVSDYGSYYLGCGAPLKNAAASGHIEIVELLLDHGADPITLNTGILRSEVITYKGENPMKQRGLLLACFVIFSAVSIFAQSGGTAADQLSGVMLGLTPPSN